MKKIINHLKENWIRHGFETLVVTIGILGAFMLNNWNEARKDKIRANSHLEELRAELLSDLSRWEEVMYEFDLVDQAGLYIYGYLFGTHENVDTLKLKDAYLRAGHLAFFSITDIAYNSLLNSGEIEHIENDSLKRMLGFLHDEDNWSRKYHDGAMQSIYENYSKYVHNFTEPIMVRNFFQKEFQDDFGDKINSTTLPINNFFIRWEELKKDSYYLLILDQVLANRVIQRHNYNEWKNDMITLVALIEDELRN